MQIGSTASMALSFKLLEPVKRGRFWRCPNWGFTSATAARLIRNHQHALQGPGLLPTSFLGYPQMLNPSLLAEVSELKLGYPRILIQPGSVSWWNNINSMPMQVEAMRARGQPGHILNIASAAGLYPAPLFPIYSGSKAGVVMFTRSLSKLHREGIRANALCPEFVETPMTKLLDKEVLDLTHGFIPMDKVLDGAFELIEDESKAGACLWITNRRGSEYWPSPEEEKKYAGTDGKA